jgi:DNA-binding NarL/FixJ family response regulator
VAAVNDYELVVAGLSAVLGRYPDRVEVRELIVMGEPIEEPVDVALYDTYGRAGIVAPAIRALADADAVRRVALFSMDLRPDVVAQARAAGATGFISKALSGAEIADAVVRVAEGHEVLATPPTPRPALRDLDWPAKDHGLTERESEILVLLAEGLSNREIAAALHLSAETVKSYLRQVFSKLGLRNRVEATTFVHRSGAFGTYRPVSAVLRPGDEAARARSSA